METLRPLAEPRQVKLLLEADQRVIARRRRLTARPGRPQSARQCDPPRARPTRSCWCRSAQADGSATLRVHRRGRRIPGRVPRAGVRAVHPRRRGPRPPDRHRRARTVDRQGHRDGPRRHRRSRRRAGRRRRAAATRLRADDPLRCRVAHDVGGVARGRRSAHSVCGVRPGPSQSHHSGLDPRTRGGSSIWTPRWRGTLTGLSVVQPAQLLRDRVDVGDDVVGRKVVAQRVADVFGERPGSGRRAAASRTCPRRPNPWTVITMSTWSRNSASVDESVAVDRDRRKVLAHPRRLDHGVARAPDAARRHGAAITSVIHSRWPPWYAMNPTRPRSSQTSSTPGASRIVAKSVIAAMMHRRRPIRRSEVGNRPGVRARSAYDASDAGVDGPRNDRTRSHVGRDRRDRDADHRRRAERSSPRVLTWWSTPPTSTWQRWIRSSSTCTRSRACSIRSRRRRSRSRRRAQQTLEFIREHVPEPATVPLCGNSIGTDRRFLAAVPPRDRELPALPLDRRVEREGTRQAVVSRPRRRTVLAGRGAHRALDDIRESVREMAYYRDHGLRATRRRVDSDDGSRRRRRRS